MATVIYGQPDKRWEALGQGLGNFAGNVYQGYETQKAAQGVAAIMQDPNVSDADKGVKALKDFGPIGYQLYNQHVATQAKQAQITGELARAKLADVQAQRGAAGLPYVAPQAAAQVGATQAETGLRGAETARTQAITSQLIPAQAAETTAAAGQKYEAIPLTRAEAQKTQAEAGILQSKLDALSRADIGQLSPEQLQRMIGPIKVPDEVKQSVVNAYNAEPDPFKKMQAAQKELSGYTQSVARGQAQAARPTEAETKYASDTREHATSALRYINTFAAGGAEKTGLLNGAPTKSFFERVGVPTGDAETVDMWNAAYQQVASAATQGGGFFANGRVKLASDTTPTIFETPLHAIIAADQVADRKIDALSVRIADHPEQKSLQLALQAWQKVKANTGTFQSFVGKDSSGNDKTIAQYNGNAIDPKSFKVTVKGSQDYTNASGAHASGSDIISKAWQYGMDPADMLARFQGGTP